jgi:hypothetical protein
MALSHDEAAQTLSEITRTGQRSSQALAYANASPFFVVWGVVWVLGYSGTYVLLRLLETPRFINWLWASLIVIGAIASANIGRAQWHAQNPGAKARGREAGRRWLVGSLVIWLFVICAALVIGPRFVAIQGAFIPLLIAMLYGLLGLFRGWRFVYAGLAVTALTLGGWFSLPQFFLLWMALVGGGSLILVGLWLKKV